jgi:hypothetical protein
MNIIFPLHKLIGSPGLLDKLSNFFHIFFKADRPALLIRSVGLGAAVHARRS